MIGLLVVWPHVLSLFLCVAAATAIATATADWRIDPNCRRGRPGRPAEGGRLVSQVGGKRERWRREEVAQGIPGEGGQAEGNRGVLGSLLESSLMAPG